VVGWHGRHTRAHLYRSILEGVGFELRLHLERLEAVTGQRVESIRAVGGGARSPLWIRIITDITQRPVLVCAESEASAAGAGVLAWEFLGGNPAPAVDEMPEAPSGREVLPDPSTTSGYDAFFAVYCRTYPSLRGLFPDLAAAANAIEER
jgi:sugar (pentulose or hexulose) kinase